MLELTLDKFDKSLPMMLYRTLDVLIPKYRAVFKQHDISETQWRILRVLWEHESCGAAELIVSGFTREEFRVEIEVVAAIVEG